MSAHDAQRTNTESLVRDLRRENTDHTENCCYACVTDRRRAAARIERLERALRQVENICLGTEDALRFAPERDIHFSPETQEALRIHVKNTRLVIAAELGEEALA